MKPMVLCQTCLNTMFIEFKSEGASVSISFVSHSARAYRIFSHLLICEQLFGSNKVCAQSAVPLGYFFFSFNFSFFFFSILSTLQIEKILLRKSLWVEQAEWNFLACKIDCKIKCSSNHENGFVIMFKTVIIIIVIIVWRLSAWGI